MDNFEKDFEDDNDKFFVKEEEEDYNVDGDLY